MENQRTSKIDLLSKMNESSVSCFQFHIVPKVLKHFYQAASNKSFLLYLLILELSNRKGFCYLNTKEVAQTFFDMTAKSICNWIKEMHNAGFITALYDAKQHFWVVRVNTKWHITLWEKYSDGSLEELLNASEKQISEDKLNKIIADAQEFAVEISKNSDNASNTQTSSNEYSQPSVETSNSDNENVNIDESNANDNSNAEADSNESSAENENSANISNDTSDTNANNADDADNQNGANSTNSADENTENEADSANVANVNDLKDSQSAIVENAENPNTNENGGKEMSAVATAENIQDDEITKEAFESMSAIQRLKADKSKMNNFWFRFLNKPKKDKSKKVLVVTPYRTIIDETDTKNIKETLEQIKFYEKFERNNANDYGTSVSPIKDALKRAEKIIAEKNIVAQNKINEITQTELNKIDFFDEKLWNKIDSVAITMVDYHNIVEIQNIHEKAESLGKEVRIVSFTTKDNKLRLEQIKEGIDDPYFYMKDTESDDGYYPSDENDEKNSADSASSEVAEADSNAENEVNSANSVDTQEQNAQEVQSADTNTEEVSA